MEADQSVGAESEELLLCELELELESEFESESESESDELDAFGCVLASGSPVQRFVGT